MAVGGRQIQMSELEPVRNQVNAGFVGLVEADGLI